MCKKILLLSTSLFSTGVNQAKYYSKKTASPEVIALLSETSREEKFEARELFFSTHRDQLQAEFLKASEDIRSCCAGFFKDPRHLASHFSWVTSSPPLNENVSKNLYKQLDLMNSVLCYKNKSVQFVKEDARRS